MSMEDEIEKLKDKVKDISIWLWGNSILGKDVDNWLNNFNTIDEKFIALTLLSEFMFYDLREVRLALKSIYKDKYIAPLVTEYRKQTDSYDIQGYEKYISEMLQKTRFASVGNPSESSSVLLYFFRQKNKISKDLFIDSCKLLTSDPKNDIIENLIYIDDISGSGGQAIRNLKGVVQDIRVKKPEIKISYFTIFATTEALNVLRESMLFDRVDTVFELDDTYKIFSETSRYFTGELDSEKKVLFEQLCRDSHRLKWKLAKEDISRNNDGTLNENECGYADGQLALGFFYNIPNNTLPIFWAESDNWIPIFKRYSKKYGA